MGTPIANTEFVISATYRRNDYAEKVSHRRIEYGPTLFQLPGFSGADQDHL